MPSTNDQITNLDAEVDALTSPTTAQVAAVTQDYDAGIVAASAVRRASGGGGGGGGAVSVASTTLTNAQVLALPTTAVEIVAAPGAGAAFVVVSAALRLTWFADYGGIDPTAEIHLDVGTNNWAAVVAENTLIGLGGVSSLLAAGEAATAVCPGIAYAPASASAWPISAYSGSFDSDIENKPINLAAVNALDFTGGNAGNSLKVTVVYYTIEF